MTFTLLPESFTIARLRPSAAIPNWATGTFVSITRTAEELSVICGDAAVPREVPADRGWRCLKLEGPIPLHAVGIAAEFLSVLARAGVSVVVVATYDTDYLLIKSEVLETAAGSLRAAGHLIR